jgi:hypothetical protein
MNRRSFLAAAAAAAFAPATFARAAEGKRRVIVVGAGLAGLSCAYELRKLGFERVVLEGQGRAGGRVQTLREGLDGTEPTASATEVSCDSKCSYKQPRVRPACFIRSAIPIPASLLSRNFSEAIATMRS